VIPVGLRLKAGPRPEGTSPPPRPVPRKVAAPSAKPSRPRARGPPTRAVTGGAILILLLLLAGSTFVLTRHGQRTGPAGLHPCRQLYRDRGASGRAGRPGQGGIQRGRPVSGGTVAHPRPARRGRPGDRGGGGPGARGESLTVADFTQIAEPDKYRKSP